MHHSALTIGPHHKANGYSAKHSHKLTQFASQMQHKHLGKNTRPPIQPLNENDNTWRHLAAVDDGLDEISYPIAAGDPCDCVTFPDAEPAMTECSDEVYWGTFQIIFTGEGCYDFSYPDESVVYANCPSGSDPDAVTEYELCEFDFRDDGTGSSSSGVAEEESTTATKSLRQETTGAAKTTHIHLTVHRLVTFALEAVLALQSTWT
jgi:hypothetical protein